MRIETIDLSHYADITPGLISHLSVLKAGQSEVFRTPLFNKAPMQSIVKAWNKVMTNSDLLSKMPGLAAIEEQQAKKVGPYSVIPPASKRMESVKSFWTIVEEVDGKEINPEAVHLVEKLFSPGALTLWALDKVKDKMRLNTNSGLPYFIKRRVAWDKYKKSGYKQKQPFMAVWGTRVQPGGPSVSDEKVRDVMMMPMLLNMLESQYYYPLLEYEQNNQLPFSVSTLRWTEEEVTKLFDTKDANDPVVNTDFSKFDQHFGLPMQEAAKRILLFAFNRAAHESILRTYDVKYNIPLLIDKDRAIYGRHGMGSGATGTNPDENLAHKALQYEAAIQKDKVLNPHSMCLGDDGILSFSGITVDDVISTYTAHGLEMNPSKQYVDTQSTYYLQRYYHVSYRDSDGVMLGVYSTNRALGRLLGQERFYDPELWSEVNVCLRSLQIIENCNNHPLFKQFIDFVKEGDKYGLGTKIPGFRNDLVEKYEAYKANFGVDSYTRQNETTSILDWKVVQYLFG